MKHLKNLARLLTALALVAAAAPAAAQARPGSIYDARMGPFGSIADRTARRPGDLITVVINESQETRNEETSTLTKGTTLDYRIDSLNLKPNLFGSTLPDVVASSQDDFAGTANYQKRGEFSARITAIVSDVLPNGNLVISGRREIRIDKETKLIEFSGIVRRFDVQPDNTIQSEMVAEARVTYSGSGPLTESTNRTGLGSFIHSAIAWIWPF